MTRLAHRLRSLGPLGLAGLALAATAGPLAAQPVLIALSGTPAPAGGNYSSFGTSPVLNASGQVAFFASTSVAGAGIFAGTPGSPLTTAALTGTAAPAGGNYTGFNNPVLNASGQVAFFASTSVAGAGIFAGTPGSPLTTAALQGTAAPAGGNYTSFNAPVLNASGQVAFLAGTSFSDNGIFAGTPGSPLTTAALVGTAAPAGGNYTFIINNPVLNASGQVAFLATTSDSSSGIFAGIPGSPLTTAALNGTAAPAGGNYISVNLPVLNASGQVAFRANSSGAGSGIFAGTPGSPLTTAAVAGTAAPTGGNYTGFQNPVLNASGQVAFVATTSVAGNGIFAGTPGSPLTTAALKGTAAPNTGGATFNGTFGTPTLNASGQVAFLGTLTTGSGSPAVTTATNQGLFAGEPGALVLCVRKGDVLAADPTSTVSAISFTTGSGGEDGKGMSFNDSGLLVYELTFADGSSGIFESQITGVPEPSTLVLTGLAALGLALRRRQKAK